MIICLWRREINCNRFRPTNPCFKSTCPSNSYCSNEDCSAAYCAARNCATKAWRSGSSQEELRRCGAGKGGRVLQKVPSAGHDFVGDPELIGRSVSSKPGNLPFGNCLRPRHLRTRTRFQDWRLDNSVAPSKVFERRLQLLFPNQSHFSP